MSVVKHVLAVAGCLTCAAVLAGCSGGSGAQDPSALEGVQWELVASNVTDVDVSEIGITMNLDAGEISGFAGVNSYAGPFETGDDGSFDAGPLATTLIAGPEPLMAAETAYLQILDASESFEVSEGGLTLRTADDETLEFVAAEPFDLAGTSWTITGYNNGKEAVVGPEPDSELTLEFGTDGTVSGSAGVNTFSGGYTATEVSIEIGPLATTMMAGPDNLMMQETAYLAALEASTEWEVVGGVLTTRNAEGAMQINAAMQ